MKEKNEIRFRDLNIWMKAGIIGGWISLITFIMGFLAGFMYPY